MLAQHPAGGPADLVGLGQRAQGVVQFRQEDLPRLPLTQGRFGEHPVGGVEHHDDDPAGLSAVALQGTDAPGEPRPVTAVRAVRDQLDVLDGDAFARPGPGVERPVRRPELGPAGGLGAAQHVRPPSAGERPQTVVVDLDAVLAPGDQHRQTAGEDHLDGVAQGRRPRLDRPQRRGCPVVRSDASGHFAVAGRPGKRAGVRHAAH